MTKLRDIDDDALFYECQRRGWQVCRPQFKTAQDFLLLLHIKYKKNIKEGPTFKKYCEIVVRNIGRMVSTNDIISHVWPNSEHDECLNRLRVYHNRFRHHLQGTPYRLRTILDEGVVLMEEPNAKRSKLD